jgi:anti-sigma-K factor RskA
MVRIEDLGAGQPRKRTFETTEEHDAALAAHIADLDARKQYTLQDDPTVVIADHSDVTKEARKLRKVDDSLVDNANRKFWQKLEWWALFVAVVALAVSAVGVLLDHPDKALEYWTATWTFVSGLVH